MKNSILALCTLFVLSACSATTEHMDNDKAVEIALDAISLTTADLADYTKYTSVGNTGYYDYIEHLYISGSKYVKFTATNLLTSITGVSEKGTFTTTSISQLNGEANFQFTTIATYTPENSFGKYYFDYEETSSGMNFDREEVTSDNSSSAKPFVTYYAQYSSGSTLYLLRAYQQVGSTDWKTYATVANTANATALSKQ